MDAYLLHKILSHLDFNNVWKWRELSKWCKKEIEDTHQRYLENINLEVCSEEDDFSLFPKEKLVFKCVWYDRERNIFKFELDTRNDVHELQRNNYSSLLKSNAPTINDNLPKFLKFWEKYCRCSVSFSVNNKLTRSYYTLAVQNSPVRKANHYIWYKTDTVYYGLRTRLADYDFFLDFYRSMDIYKELIACGYVRTKSTQSKIALMQEDVQRIIKELKLYEQNIEECPIYMHATPSFLFPQLRNKVCVFPDRLQALETSVEVPNDSYDVKSSAVVKWLASNSSPTPPSASHVPRVYKTQNYVQTKLVN